MLLDIDWRFFDYMYMGEKVSHYLAFAGIILATLLLKHPVAILLARISSRMTARFSYMRHKAAVSNMLFKPMERLLQVVLYFVAVEQISGLLDRVAFRVTMLSKHLPVSLGEVTDHVFLFLFIVYLTQLIGRFIDFIHYLRAGKAQMEKNASLGQLLPLFREVAKLLLWTVSIFWILGSVFHVNIPALITGLGVGGVAIALAGKETVENFFAAFTILSDKPFEMGDAIKLGNAEGVVERIGFRSTRVRNYDGSLSVIPNQSLVSQNVINLSTRDTFGMQVVANIRYGMTHTELSALITALKDALAQMPLVKPPVDIYIEAFDKETFRLVIAYFVEYPLPEGLIVDHVKRDMNLKVFEVISANGVMGTPIGTG